MNIYYLSHSRIPSRFANSVHVMKMCQCFALNGHNVLLFAKAGEQSFLSDFQYYGILKKFDIHKIPFNPSSLLKGLKFVFDFKSLIKTLPKPDIFYARHLYCAAAVKSFSVPIYMEMHQPPQNMIEYFLLKVLIKSGALARLIIISEALANVYIRLFPSFPRDKIIIAHDGADPVMEDIDTSQTEPWPGRQGHIQVGYFGSLYNGRGITQISELAQGIPDMDFHIMGGTLKEVNFWKSKSEKVENLYFHGYITPFLGDQYRARMDILVAPYQEKVASAGNRGNIARCMSPLKIFEYMASGKAIIASNLTTIKEILDHEKNAILVEPQNISEWKSALQKLADIHLREFLGNNAKKKFLENYTWQIRAVNVLK